MKEKIKRIRFCPKCKSVKVKKEFTFFMVFGAPQKWVCQDCGFKGHIFPEKEIKSKEKK
jgi:rubredoxin